MGCDCCNKNEMDSWTIRKDVPQSGYAFLQNVVSEFFPDRPDDKRIISVYVGVKYIGTPPNVHGGGVYEITSTIGFDHMVGRRFGIGYGCIEKAVYNT